MSDPDCRHSQAIPKNDGVAGSMSNESKEPNFGVQFEGRLLKLIVSDMIWLLSIIKAASQPHQKPTMCYREILVTCLHQRKFA